MHVIGPCEEGPWLELNPPKIWASYGPGTTTPTLIYVVSDILDGVKYVHNELNRVGWVHQTFNSHCVFHWYVHF